jgi:hypothetical protein
MTENDLTGLLLKLADRGVTGIKIYYAGGGDSGAVEDVVYTTMDLSKSDEDEAFEFISELATYGADKAENLKDLDSGACSDISDFAEEAILNDVEDWWNNEGGYGALCICIPSGKYIINNSIRITETEDFLHEGS